MDKQNYITVSEAAELAGKSNNTIFNWLRAGKLKRYKSGDQTLVSKAELEEFLRIKEV